MFMDKVGAGDLCKLLQKAPASYILEVLLQSDKQFEHYLLCKICQEKLSQ